HVASRRGRRAPGLTRASPLLVHRARRDLLGALCRRAAFLLALLDVLVLPFALLVPRLLGHMNPPCLSGEWYPLSAKLFQGWVLGVVFLGDLVGSFFS